MINDSNDLRCLGVKVVSDHLLIYPTKNVCFFFFFMGPGKEEMKYGSYK